MEAVTWLPLVVSTIAAIASLYIANHLSTVSKSEEKKQDKIDEVVSKFSILEVEFRSLKNASLLGDDVKYRSQKALDSAARAHERLDESADAVKELRALITIQEKTIIKLDVISEALQERLRGGL